MSINSKISRKESKFADEVRNFEKGKIETVTLGGSGVTIGRSIFEPGWSGKNA